MDSSWKPSTSTIIKMYLRLASKIVLILCAICFVSQLSGYNITDYITKYKIINIIVMLAIVASIIYYVIDRNFYLPFLGWAVYPCGSLAEKVPLHADTNINVNVPPGVNVIYWASESSTPDKQPIDNPWDAYANYDNSGVVKSDSNGNAILRFRKPSYYKVGVFNTTLKIHVHYRICKYPGMLSDIKTIML